MERFQEVTIVGEDGSEVSTGSGRSWLASAPGTVFVGAATHSSALDGSAEVAVNSSGTGSTVTAYAVDDLDTPLWTKDVGDEAASYVQHGAPAVEFEGYAFFPLPGWSHATAQDPANQPYGHVLDLADGSTAQWFPPHSSVRLVDGVAVVNDGTSVRGIDIATGEERWESEPGAWEDMQDGDQLYLVPRSSGDLQRLDPRTGRVRWAREMEASVEEIMSLRGTFWHGDPVLKVAGWGETTIVRHDARDGRVRMSLDLDAEHYAVGLYAGEGQLLVALAEESGHTFQFRSVMGVDPDTGEVRWRKFDGDPFVVGGHLVVRTDDGITVYR